MGFLRRLVGGGGGGRRSSAASGPEWPPAGPITTWPVGEAFESKFPAVLFLPRPGATVEVTGESACQDTLALIAGGRTLDGSGKPAHVAMLLPEPSNAGDPFAVRVVIIPSKPGRPWGKVGYLSREDAERYQPVVDRVALIGKVTACRASLMGEPGGSEGGGAYTVTLHLDTPENLMLKLARELGV
jgi:hypothetical protein